MRWTVFSIANAQQNIRGSSQAGTQAQQVCLQCQGGIWNTFWSAHKSQTIWPTNWKLCVMITHKLKLMCTNYEVIHWEHVEVISNFVGGISGGHPVEYKIAAIYYSVITCTAPPYLSDLLEPYIPLCTLCSSAGIHIFHIKKKTQEILRTACLFFHWCLGLEQSPFLCVTCPDFVFLQVTVQDSPFLCLLLPTLPAVSSLSQVSVCVCVCT